MSDTKPLAWLAGYWFLLTLLLAFAWVSSPLAMRTELRLAAAPVQEEPAEVPAPALSEEQRARLRLAQYLAQTWRVDEAEAVHIVQHAYHYAARHRLPPTLLLAIMAQESSFRADAVSSVGAVGLMQVTPRWHEQRRQALGHVAPLTDPATNIAVGAHILDEYLRRARGNLNKALDKYSGGATNYAPRVLRYQREFERIVAEQQAT